MMDRREDWLKLTVEKAIEPEMPICDPHFHFFNNPEIKYLMADVLRDIKGGHNIVKNVYLDCHTGYRTTGPAAFRPVGETEFVVDLVAQNAKIIPEKIKIAAGIVSAADLNLGEAVGPVLAAHVAAGKGRFKGIRQEITPRGDPRIKPDPNVPRRCQAADKKFREGFSALRKLGLSFDTILYLPHLAQLIDLARAFPDTNIIINHAGIEPSGDSSPGVQAQMTRDWQKAIVALAACQNVYMKLGGFGMGLGINWHERPAPPGSAELAKAAAPYILWCIEKLGSQRCMFESNYPIESFDLPFNVVWNAFKLITKDLPRKERNNLFYNTAVQAYRLD